MKVDKTGILLNYFHTVQSSVPPFPISRGKIFYNRGRDFLYSQLALFIKRIKEILKTLLSKSYMLIVDIYLDWLVTFLTSHSKYLRFIGDGLQNL